MIIEQENPCFSRRLKAMIALEDITSYLNEIAPLKLAESWDNTGLLFGPTEKGVKKILTCLTLTSDVLEEAIQKEADLIVSHHPILFRGAKQITTGTAEGRLLIQLAKSDISVYSAHTAYDNATGGINHQIALSLGLWDINPIKVHPAFKDELLGTGKYGEMAYPAPMGEILNLLKTKYNLQKVTYTGDSMQKIYKIGIVCGSGGDYLADAIKLGCNLFITGEANYHAQLKAREENVGLILMGHLGSERFAMQVMAKQLHQKFPELECWLSTRESDPYSTTFV